MVRPSWRGVGLRTCPLSYTGMTVRVLCTGRRRWKTSLLLYRCCLYNARLVSHSLRQLNSWKTPFLPKPLGKWTKVLAIDTFRREQTIASCLNNTRKMSSAHELCTFLYCRCRAGTRPLHVFIDFVRSLHRQMSVNTLNSESESAADNSDQSRHRKADVTAVYPMKSLYHEIIGSS